MRVIGTSALTIAVAAAVALAHGGKPDRIPKPSDPIALRHYMMENIGDLTEELKDELEAGRVKEMTVTAQAIAVHSTQIAALFPKGSTTNKSRAKPEIWERWDDFERSADELGKEADELAVVAGEGDAEKAGAQLKKLYGACKGCHEDFRKPEKKKADSVQ